MGQRVMGKVALITGAARGQGAAHAVALAREGADIVLVDCPSATDSVLYPLADERDLDRIAAEVEALGRRVITARADVRSQADMNDAAGRAVAEPGGVDIVVANAGIWNIASPREPTDAMWQDVIDIHLTGVRRTIKAAAPHLLAQRSGRIVVVSSVDGIRAVASHSNYVASKARALGLMEAAIELGPHNIRCNAVCPGMIDTKVNDCRGAYDMMSGSGRGRPEHRRPTPGGGWPCSPDEVRSRRRRSATPPSGWSRTSRLR
jgi:NAD(P)-dependent dehydrogenase (short-subunit alcohol dehydrogenase family)